MAEFCPVCTRRLLVCGSVLWPSSSKTKEYLEGVAPEIRDVLEGTFSEASHVMSPTGLRDYLEGAKALANLGRGSDL